MKVYGFVGPSGTGKSYQAQAVARELGADLIIDDGLLIAPNKVLAGVSAKKESTRLSSVRRALFFNEEHKNEVRQAVLEAAPEKLLILGTSDGMVARIAQNLGFGEIESTVYIESVSAPDEIERAKQIRAQQGKHAIPVPTFEIKRDFSGYLIDRVRLLRRSPKTNKKVVEEKSVVRPTFSYLGSYMIANSVLVDICVYESMKVPGVRGVYSCIVTNVEGGAKIKIELILKYGGELLPVAHRVREVMRVAVERYTSINVVRADVVVKKLSL